MDLLDVLVVGAGPTGLTLAAELRRFGLSVRVVDKAKAATTLSKAIIVHARTLEAFEPMGIAEEAISLGQKVAGARVFANGHCLVEASFDELDSRHRFALAIAQSETEALLSRHLERLGGVVERGAELLSIEERNGRMVASLRHADGRDETVHARWLVGCDGSHSVVRKSLGLDFDGSSYDEGFLLADVRCASDLPRDRIHTFFSDEGALACFPMPKGRVRLIASMPGDTSRDEPTLAEIQTLVDRRSGLSLKLSDDVWRARFRIHCRQVETYRRGRAFLAGDAAHIHSPIGGQGMNTGIQDAQNLAWKLAFVAKGRAAETLLDSYGTERHAIGAALLRATDAATRVATLQSPVARSIRNQVAHFLGSLDVIQQRIVRSIAELDLSYAGGPLASEHPSLIPSLLATSGEAPGLAAWRAFAAGPRAGHRAPDGAATNAASGKTIRLYEDVLGRDFALLLFDGRAVTPEGYERLTKLHAAARLAFGEAVSVWVVVPLDVRPEGLPTDVPVLLDPEGDLEHRYGAAGECVYVVRPDLYVGYREQPASASGALTYLRRIFDLPSTEAPAT